MIPVIHTVGATEFGFSTDYVMDSNDPGVDFTVAWPDGMVEGDTAVILTVATMWGPDDTGFLRNYQTNPPSSGSVFQEEGYSFQATVFQLSYNGQADITFTLPRVYSYLLGVVFRVEGAATVNTVGVSANPYDAGGLVLLPEFVQSAAVGSVAVRMIASDALWTLEFPPFTPGFQLESPEGEAVLKLFASDGDETLEGTGTYPDDYTDVQIFEGNHFVGVTIVIAEPIETATGSCFPLRQRQRDDQLQTPRVRYRTPNTPTSVGFSFRRGWMNTYDGPGDCEGTGPAS